MYQWHSSYIYFPNFIWNLYLKRKRKKLENILCHFISNKRIYKKNTASTGTKRGPINYTWWFLQYNKTRCSMHRNKILWSWSKWKFNMKQHTWKKKMCCHVFLIKGTAQPIPRSVMYATGQMQFSRLHVSIMCTTNTTSRDSQL